MKSADDTPAPAFTLLPTSINYNHWKPNPVSSTSYFISILLKLFKSPGSTLSFTSLTQSQTFGLKPNHQESRNLLATLATRTAWGDSRTPMHDSWVYDIQLFGKTARRCFEWTRPRIIIRNLRLGGGSTLNQKWDRDAGKSNVFGLFDVKYCVVYERGRREIVQENRVTVYSSRYLHVVERQMGNNENLTTAYYGVCIALFQMNAWEHHKS